MGFGKTIVSLTAIEELLADGVLSKVLVIAPLKVCTDVWAKEHLKWAHTEGLRINIATGSQAQRTEACEDDECDILVINYEVVPWFVDTYGKTHGCDGLLIDELSKFKAGGLQFKKLRKVLPTFMWRVGMTGTPVSEDFLGLFYQVMALDCGARLGANKEVFKRKYFYPTDHQGYKWEIRGEREELALMTVISDLVFMAEDYTGELPELEKMLVRVHMPKKAWAVYKRMAKTSVVDGITAGNAAVLSGKLRQIAAGFMYADEDEIVDVHAAKLVQCVQMVNETASPVMVVHEFSEDRERLREAFIAAGLRVGLIGGGGSRDEFTQTVAAWNARELDVLLLHPKSGGHGLQLERGGHEVIFYNPIWSRDSFDQTVARLWRRGQTEKVRVRTLMCVGTVDELVVGRSKDKKVYYRKFVAHLDAVQKS